MNRKKYFLLGLTSLLLDSSAIGQDPRGTILGRVVDSSDAVIVGVEIRATNVDTGITASARTSERGSYRIPFLIPGMYRVTAELSGFKRFARDKVEVRVSDTVELAIRMELGDVAETVEVSATTPLLETATSSLGQVVDERRLSALPQRGGNPMELQFLAPGVVNGTNLRILKASSPNGTSSMAADGGGSFSTEFQMDGITDVGNDTGRGQARVSFIPPSSAINEYKIETSPYDASVGRTSGAVVNVNTKSGTNRLRGELRYWARNSAFDAADFFNNKNNTKKDVYQDHRYGLAVGGPLYIPQVYDGRNRTFWFYAWERNTWDIPSRSTATVPTAAQRGGDFSALLGLGSNYQIYNPFSTRPAPGGRFEREPFPNNVIPKSMLDPVALKLVDYYPLPNQSGTADGRNNVFYPDIRPQEYWVHMGRADHAFSENYRLFLRVHRSFYSNRKDNLGVVENAFFIQQKRQGLALDNVFVLSPTMVLNVRYGVNNAQFLEQNASRGIDLGSLGFSPALTRLIDPSLARFPHLSPGAYSQFADWQDGDGGTTSLTHSLVAGFTKVAGSHNLKFGADARLTKANGNRFPKAVSPDLAYNSTYTLGPLDSSPQAPIGQGLAAMLLGIPQGSMEFSASYALQDKYLGLYFQDDFKLNPKLTLNLGLRYAYETGITERYDRLVANFAFDQSNPIEAAARENYAQKPIPELPADQFRVLGGLTFVTQDGIGRSPFTADHQNLMPRIGLAYQLTPKTILRSGYGIFYDTYGVNKTTAIQTGFSQATPIIPSFDNGLTFVATNANPLPNGLLPALGPVGGLTTNLGQNLDFYDRNRKHPYSQRWSFGIQRLLPNDFLLDTSYVANRGTRLPVARDINATPAQYLSTSPVRDQNTIDFLTAKFPSPFSGLDPVYSSRISREGLLKPYPQFNGISVDEPVGYSWYHSLQVRAEKRFSQGYTVQLAYTYSKLMEATGFLNPTDPTPYEVIGSLDSPHRVAISGLWEIPVGRRRRFGSSLPGVAQFVVGGWQLSGKVIHQSGLPLSWGNILFNGDVKDIPLPSDSRTADRWFNIDAGFNRDSKQQLSKNLRAFPTRLAGVRQDSQDSWDFAFIKDFPISEVLTAQFRAEVYNTLNQTTFNAPNRSPTSGAFGKITSTAGDARSWQFALRITF